MLAHGAPGAPEVIAALHAVFEGAARIEPGPDAGQGGRARPRISLLLD
jgi:hypothetical protein